LIQQRKSITYIASIYGVSTDTINRFVKKHNVAYIPWTAVVCIETGKLFHTATEGALTMYPGINERTAQEVIRKSIKKGQPYKGYSWKDYYS
jgi:peptidase E